ncbi:RagB/SusD family nutrient uptake outer membrane protein [Chitinophaga rhizophila]|uniref:RagB/SusD family nutrient uptake outer membrane protein n=1 Tax=Chitinophaga rhizophila TaxID=2866212 RepID=A0ABS7GHC2_9BACT|nr:RagB/SusD family nutrient uptake outer membrane protein [Chitinophaga rhizophila]MBW8687098.1 RagB/SusD family nutrient uptake outer membrane protein [Chitinophaga rhizophila]
MSIIKRFIYIALGSAALVYGTGCRKYVEVTPQGKRALVNTSDYQLLLQSQNTFQTTYAFPAYAADDYGISNTTYEMSMMASQGAAYTWAESFVVDAEDPDWQKCYQQIYVSNEIIAGVRDAQGGTAMEKETIRAGALVHRAYSYLMLVNAYARHYNKATAATDPGVPVLLTPDLFAKLNRASVQTVYDQVFADCKEAASILPARATTSLLPSAAAAYGLMARAALYMADYTAAAAYADSALARQSGLLDLRQYVNNTVALPLIYSDPEVMLAKSLNVFSAYALNPDLLALFETGDLRYGLFTADGSNYQWSSFPGRGYWRSRLMNTGPWAGPNVPEMMLIRAEADARGGRTADAVSLLNKLREKRFTAETYQELSAANAQDALRLVIKERRMELMATGLRWFDQKRLNMEPGFEVTVTRTYRGETFTLEPNSNRYIFPIAAKYIQFNPEISQNPR